MMRSIYTPLQRVSMEYETLLPGFSISFESTRNSDNVAEARKTLMIIDNFPRISPVKNNSINENKKSYT